MRGGYQVIHSKYAGRVVSLLVVLPMFLSAQKLQEVVPLKNWSTPLYWQPNQTERESVGTALSQNGATQRGGAQIVFSTNAVSANALTFVAITPCRLVDTRGGVFNGMSPFSGPSITATSTATFPVQSTAEASADTAPAPCGIIPTIAQAYSLNLTVVPHAAGMVDFVTMWPASAARPFVSTLDDPQGAIISNAAIVPAGPTGSPYYGGISVYSQGPATTDVIIDMNGYFASPTDVTNNTAVGLGSLASATPSTPGTDNTAIGLNTLFTNTAGNFNTAVGESAGFNNTGGDSNVFVGLNTGYDNTTGGTNTFLGSQAGYYNQSGNGNTYVGFSAGKGATGASLFGTNNTYVGNAAGTSTFGGNDNVFFGASAGQNNTTGSNNEFIGLGTGQSNTTGNLNTAVGNGALSSNQTGANNIAIGQNAADSVASSNSNNIDIGSAGVSADGASANAGVIRIGTTGTQTSFFAAGITGVNVSGVNVQVDSNGQLGVIVSSRRFKEDIQDMGDSSSGLLRLHPVTFHYKQPFADGSKPIEYGLIAEEVAEVYPDLVAHSADGQIETVKYQVLDSMLLNELQKQADQNRRQAEQIRSLEERLAAVEALLPAAPEPAR
jgi:hypothetical protein